VLRQEIARQFIIFVNAKSEGEKQI